MVVLTNKHTGNSFRFNLSEMNNFKIDNDTIILETEEGSNIALSGENGKVINPSYSIRPMMSLDDGLPILRVIGKKWNVTANRGGDDYDLHYRRHTRKCSS